MAIEAEAGFSRAILEEAQRERDDILELARREAERILDNARAELDQIYVAESPDAKTQKARARYNQIVATAELEARKKLLFAKEEYIQEVQKRVKERVEQLRDGEQYTDLLVDLIQQALKELEGERFEVIVAPEDQPCLADDMLAQMEAKTGKHVARSSQTRPGMLGAIVQRSDGRVLCNYSFQAILQRRQQELRTLIAQELFDEKDG